MKRIKVILFIIISFNTIKAQHIIGLKLQGGASQIRQCSVYSFSSNSTVCKIRYNFSFIGNGGIYYNLLFNNNLLFGTEIVFMQMKGWEHADFSNVYSHDKLTIDNFGHLSYIGIPIYFGRRSNKFSFNIGILPLYLLSNNWNTKLKSSNDSITNSVETDVEIDIDRFDIGSRIGMVYNLCKWISIEGNYYFGINNLLDKDEAQDYYMYNQQFSLGLRLNIITKTKTGANTAYKQWRAFGGA